MGNTYFSIQTTAEKPWKDWFNSYSLETSDSSIYTAKEFPIEPDDKYLSREGPRMRYQDT